MTGGCEFCSGSFWLDDNRALGPCVCATTDALLEALEDRDRELDLVWHELGEDADGQAAGPAVRRVVDSYAEPLEAAADAFRSWLVRHGHPAAPLKLEDPDLDALADALF